GISSSWPPGAPTNLPFTPPVPAPDTSSHQALARGSPVTEMFHRPLNCWSSSEAAGQAMATTKHPKMNTLAETDRIEPNVSETQVPEEHRQAAYRIYNRANARSHVGSLQ